MSGTTNGTGVECIDSFELRQVPENGLQAPPGKPVLQLALADGPPLCSVQWGMQGGLSLSWGGVTRPGSVAPDAGELA